MAHPISIGGREVKLEWSLETSRRHMFRLSTIGGHPSNTEMRKPATATAAMFKILWSLLPPSDFAAYASPEDLFAATDESEHEAIMKAIVGIYAEMAPSVEKKRSSKK